MKFRNPRKLKRSYISSQLSSYPQLINAGMQVVSDENIDQTKLEKFQISKTQNLIHFNKYSTIKNRGIYVGKLWLFFYLENLVKL